MKLTNKQKNILIKMCPVMYNACFHSMLYSNMALTEYSVQLWDVIE